MESGACGLSFPRVLRPATVGGRNVADSVTAQPLPSVEATALAQPSNDACAINGRARLVSKQ